MFAARAVYEFATGKYLAGTVSLALWLLGTLVIVVATTKFALENRKLRHQWDELGGAEEHER